MSNEIILGCHDLHLEIGNKLLCDSLSLRIKPGETWAVLGLNGAGKTTLLHTLAGIRQADRGRVSLNGRNITEYSRHDVARHLALLLQTNQDPFPGQVIEHVMIGRHPHLKAFQWESEQDYQIAKDALAMVGLAGFENRDIQHLSGGEYQRMLIAMVLVQQPAIYLLDEPVNHLDWQHQHQLLSRLCSLTENNNKALFMALHDVNLAARYCSHTLMMFDDGSVKAGPTADLLTIEHLQALYHTPILQVESQRGQLFTPA
ncbi:MAG: ABC transporter ATP-binding protein [Thioalkalispiraceae bacterium]|jgi:iron complex transport system ATP-binding protein